MKLSTKIRLFIVLLILGFCALCTVMLPRCADHITVFTAISPTVIWAIGATLCLPCVAILALSMRFAGAIERDEIFTLTTAGNLRLIAWIFFADCTAFLVGIIALFILGDSLLTPIFALIDLVGFSIGVLLRILSGYIQRAAALQEEVEGTL